MHSGKGKVRVITRKPKQCAGYWPKHDVANVEHWFTAYAGVREDIPRDPVHGLNLGFSWIDKGVAPRILVPAQ